MDHAVRRWLVALLVAVPATVTFAQVAGSVGRGGTPSVGAALSDKEGYLNQQYVANGLKTNVHDEVVQGGGKAVNFKRVTVTSKVVMDRVGAAVPTVFESEMIFENAGSGLVKLYSTSRVNGFEQSTYFALGYKGMMPLRWQTIIASATSMPAISEVVGISQFAPEIDKAHFGYALQMPSTVQNAPPVEVRYECTAGNAYPASQLIPDMQGSAHDLECRSLNVNGIVSAITRYSYLEKYDLAIETHFKSGTGETSVTLTGFKEG